MNTTISIILDDSIIYCSQESFYPKSEIIIITNSFLKQLAEERNWILHQIILQSTSNTGPEKILIRRFASKNKKHELILTVSGHFQNGAAVGYLLLDELYENISTAYSIEKVGKWSARDLNNFKIFCDFTASGMIASITDKLLRIYPKRQQEIMQNQLIYMSISTNGLPVLSNLFENQTLFRVDDIQKRNLITTALSGQLATISTNTLIRAKCYLHSIQFKIDHETDQLLFFNFIQIGNLGQYLLETLSTGDPDIIYPHLLQIASKINSYPAFFTPFTGILKQFHKIESDLAQLQNTF
jgi:hypothetical protein